MNTVSSNKHQRVASLPKCCSCAHYFTFSFSSKSKDPAMYSVGSFVIAPVDQQKDLNWVLNDLSWGFHYNKICNIAYFFFTSSREYFLLHLQSC